MLRKKERQRVEVYLGPLETRILEVLWTIGPASVSDVLERLNATSSKDLVYNTVMSTLARLADKGQVSRTREGRAYIYDAGTLDDFLRRQAADTAKDLYDNLGNMGLAGIVDGLSRDEDALARLRELLEEQP